jgi:hypothetical protein
LVALAGVVAVLLGAVLYPFFVHAAASPNPSAGGSPPASQNPPSVDQVYPGQLTMDYAGSAKGYFGPSQEPFCGNTGICVAPSTGYFSYGSGGNFNWDVTIANPTMTSHVIDYFGVSPGFVLKTFCVGYHAPCDQNVTIQGGGTIPFNLLIEAPTSPGIYTLEVTAVTEN